MFDKANEIRSLETRIKSLTTKLERLKAHTDTNCLSGDHVTDSQATGYHGNVHTICMHCGKVWIGRD